MREEELCPSRLRQRWLRSTPSILGGNSSTQCTAGARQAPHRFVRRRATILRFSAYSFRCFDLSVFSTYWTTGDVSETSESSKSSQNSKSSGTSGHPGGSSDNNDISTSKGKARICLWNNPFKPGATVCPDRVKSILRPAQRNVLPC